TLRVTNEDNGQDDTTAVGFSIAFLYTATFTAELSGYTFNNSTDPSGSLSGGGSCSFTGGAGAANPATCLVTQPGVPTVWTLGTYNHQVVGTSTDVACTGGNEISCSFNVACRNYDVDGVTINNGATADVGDVNNSGQITESTELEFSSITQGAQVVVTFSSDDEPVTCAYDGSGNKSSCSNYAPACD
ncbi:MAG TPA: hypothetical protein VFY12_00300, partial [Arenimonas sp.]|nr:hypothetical protein [Arenimonas sp.]